ncbi:MAG: aminotransferase class I/II-fold pyridoxal phosphate-dependent enzyme [Acidobacteriota bacterium]
MTKRRKNSDPDRPRGTSSRLIHGRRLAPLRTRPVATPIYQTSNFAFESTEELRRYHAGEPGVYLYTRIGNPTLDSAASRLAEAEGADTAVLTASGLGAISCTCLGLLSHGDRVLSIENLYGGTFKLFQRYLPRFGIGVDLFPVERPEEAEKRIRPETRMLYLESPTNPTLAIADLEAYADIARRHALISVIDGTFASPVNQQPLSLGIDIVLHSATKYLGGHSDLIAGVVAGSGEPLQRIRHACSALGINTEPQTAFLLERGLKTLVVRVERQNQSALQIARYLEAHSGVRRALYPGLESHPQHALARRQMRGFGGVVTFEIEGGLEAAVRLIDRLRLFANAASLGGVESLASSPLLTSQRGWPKEILGRAGVLPGMVRLSVGLEDVEDLIGDLDQALAGG